MPVETWLADIPSSTLQPQRTAAERAVEILRASITEGNVRPGTRLSEETLSSTLGVSRNTLREAFRILSQERLLIHKVNRGVFVRDPSPGDVAANFGFRRILELSALQLTEHHSPERIRAILLAVKEGERAAEENDWVAVGTANMRFHQAIAGLANNSRVDEAMSRVLAETRLAFHRRPADLLHRPFVPLNRRVYELIEQGDPSGAAKVLAHNLDLAEAELLQPHTDSAME